MYASSVVPYISGPSFKVMQSQQVIDVGLKRTTLIATVFEQENILSIDIQV